MSKLNSLPESIAFMCTVVLRGYEVYIIGGRNDYGTINHFLSNDLPPKNIRHLLFSDGLCILISGCRVILKFEKSPILYIRVCFLL